MSAGKPDLVLTSVFARIFLRPLNDGRYTGPAFMYDPIRWWSGSPDVSSAPKFVYGGRKIICQMPPECDASISVLPPPPEIYEMIQNYGRLPTGTMDAPPKQAPLRSKIVLSMRDMAKDLRLIPLHVLEQRAEAFHYSWSNLSMYGSAMHQQVGITQEEFEHMQRAFGPGTWEAEVLVEVQGNDYEYFHA